MLKAYNEWDMPENASPSDKELVIMALREREFFGNIVERYEARLNRYISRLGIVDPDDREDVLQEIFIKVYKNLNSYDQSLSFSAWIYRIAHNEAITWYRRLKVRPEGYLVADSDLILNLISDVGVASAEEKFDQAVDSKLLLREMEKLDEKYREVLLLRFFEHLEYEEISDVLKVPVGTVGTLIHRAKKNLKDKLKEQDKLKI